MDLELGMRVARFPGEQCGDDEWWGWINNVPRGCIAWTAVDLVRFVRRSPQQMRHQQDTGRPRQHHSKDHSLDGRHRIFPRLIHERDS
jgi:hypothetical protein